MEVETKTPQDGKRTSFWRRHRWLMWVTGIAIVALAGLTVAGVMLAHRAEPILRARIVQALSEHFHARVELDSFHIRLRNGLWAEGGGLRIWPPSERGAEMADAGQQPPAEGKPLISLDKFSFHAPLHYDPAKPVRIPAVKLEGLNIDIPPHDRAEHDTNAHKPKHHIAAALFRFEIGSLTCAPAHLTIETNKPGKLPLEFDIAHLQVDGLTGDQAMRFEAELTNPKPKGTIHTRGYFGPWQVDDPGESPLHGDYHFENADLGTFKGIGGIMNSVGNFQGTLSSIAVNGTTDTPEFRLTHFGAAVPLHTEFHALVDGTNGDTRLNQVNAVLEHSPFQVSGQIVHLPAGNGHPAGHDIALSLDIEQGRMEDFLSLTSKAGNPLLTGALKMKAHLDIPPGHDEVHQRIEINGRFVLTDAQFTNPKIQDRVAELSARGQGKPDEAKSPQKPDVHSTMSGDFQMGGGVIHLPKLEYTVPGATINMKGTYGVEGGKLDFTGWAKLQATVSQIVGGWKGFLLKPLDSYFKKGTSGAAVPIQVSGTRDDPHFGIDFGRLRKTPPQRPDTQK